MRYHTFDTGKVEPIRTKQRIKGVSICHTPENWAELDDYISGLSGSEKAVAYLGAYMAWNLAAKIVNEGLENE